MAACLGGARAGGAPGVRHCTVLSVLMQWCCVLGQRGARAKATGTVRGAHTRTLSARTHTQMSRAVLDSRVVVEICPPGQEGCSDGTSPAPLLDNKEVGHGACVLWLYYGCGSGRVSQVHNVQIHHNCGCDEPVAPMHPRAAARQ